MNQSNQTTFIILGATGDLCRRKLIPAIYHMVKNKKIKKFAIVGAAFTNTTIDKILEKSKKFISKIDKTVWTKLCKSSYYCKLDFYKKTDYNKLNELIIKAEKENKLNGNRVFHLATLPQHFEKITLYLSKCKIVNKNQKKPWSRIVYEKPFGDDLKSSKKINKCITKLFDESQIYRIDHFLWEELVGNIALIRFTNLFFQPLWNKKYIESIQINLIEKLGIGTRGSFYDRYGTLKDVVQNHMLQMLALVTMETPKKLSGQFIRNEKAKVLKQVKFDDIILGQYKGYRQEKGVNPKSQTETFVALKLKINNKRWRGVPIFLKTGKCLSKKETSIEIKFKKSKCLQDQCPTTNNRLSIHIQPREGFFIELNTKTPGFLYQTVPAKMDFCHPCLFGPNTPQAYENLLHDVIQGDQSMFVRFDEIEYSWKLIDKILSKKHKIYKYEKGSDGPKIRWEL